MKLYLLAQIGQSGGEAFLVGDGKLLDHSQSGAWGWHFAVDGIGTRQIQGYGHGFPRASFTLTEPAPGRAVTIRVAGRAGDQPVQLAASGRMPTGEEGVELRSTVMEVPDGVILLSHDPPPAHISAPIEEPKPEPVPDPVIPIPPGEIPPDPGPAPISEREFLKGLEAVLIVADAKAQSSVLLRMFSGVPSDIRKVLSMVRQRSRDVQRLPDLWEEP